MRLRKRLNIIRVGLAMAAVAILPVATAQAKPTPASQNTQQSSVEIPYLSHGQGVDHSQFTGNGVSPDDRDLARGPVATLGPDDRAVSRGTVETPSVEIPYLSYGQGVTAAELGFATSNSVDDRPYPKGPVQAPITSVGDGGGTIDVNPYAITGFGLALLLVMGSLGLAIRQTRKSALSPA